MLAVCERRGVAGNFWKRLPAYSQAVDEAYGILASLGLAQTAPARPANWHMASSGCSRSPSRLRPSQLCCSWTSLQPACRATRVPSCRAIAGLSQEITVLFIEHDMNLVFKFASRIIVMVAGSILVEGTPQEIAADARVREVYLGGAHHG